MDKSLCFYFQVHQPDRLRLYRFFDIGNDSQYFDEFANKTILKRVAERCYLPMNSLMLELIDKYKGEFRIAYSISGVALEQFEKYAPEVLESFKKLAATKCVEFMAETYSHSLASLASAKEFKAQVKAHAAAIKKYFGVTPKAFRNTELIYSDQIGAQVADMGYNVMLTEGAKHILGWKSPNYLYTNAINPKMKLLLKNFNLSDDIAFRFSDRSNPNWPLTSEKYAQWLNEAAVNDEVINVSQAVKDLDFIPDVTLFGYDLGVTPWDSFGKPYWWLIFIPLLNLGLMYLSQFLSRKLQYQSTIQEQANNQMNSMKIMMLVMPLMTMFITFKFASAIGIYWIFRTILSMLQQVILYKAMPYPQFTEEDYKRAEMELKGKKSPKVPENYVAGDRPIRSLHHIDDDE